ncbi:MAG: ABC transporter ATP-binding protein [Ktedonobacterales bacterium]|nr:ABC transporter ATP-binding protein [Ktedonobacterales bacterium]
MSPDWGEVQKGKREHVTVGRVLTLFAPYKLYVVGVLICILIGAALGVIPAYLTAQIIDRAIGGHDAHLLVTLSIATVVLVLVAGLVGVLQSYLNNVIGQRVMADMREKLYRHLMDLSLRFFGRNKLGDLMSRFNNDIGGIQNVVTNTFVSIVSNVVTIIVTLVFMIAFNPLLALVAVIIVPAFAIPTRQVGKVRRRLSRATQEKLAEMGSFLEETLGISGILLVKNFVRQDYESGRFNKTSREIMALQIRQNMVGRWFFMFIGLFSTLGPALVYLVGGFEVIGVIKGHVTVGEIVAFVALLGRLYPPTTQLMNVWVDIQGSASLFDRIFEVFDEPRDIADQPGAPALPPVQGHIAFEHVDFAYVENREALHDLSFEVQPGQLVALVGPSGAGKTTVTMLIPRIYDVTGGTVSIDGHDVRDVQLYSLDAQLGMVTQETYLFHTTLRENIAYGRPAATEDEIIAAAQAANIHDFIMELPEGYDTIVGERGYKLSGGEKQRIAIARVILKDPRILILDEATSSLDSHSEALIQAALEPLMRQRTTVVIAHRLSTILAANTILVLDHGQIVERGSHRDLLAQDGMYAQLYREQFRAETERMTALQAAAEIA